MTLSLLSSYTVPVGITFTYCRRRSREKIPVHAEGKHRDQTVGGVQFPMEQFPVYFVIGQQER